MAAKKTSRKQNTVKSRAKQTARTKSRKKQEASAEGFGTDIFLLVMLAAAVLMILSFLGVCGTAGAVISAVFFGIMGIMAWVFPVVLFLGAVFGVSNKKNRLAHKKMLACLIFFLFLCGLIQLLTEGYMRATTLEDYYVLSSSYHTGGGIIGGAICISTISAFGVAGGSVIMVLVLLISLIIITQRSFFGFIFHLYDLISQGAKNRHEEYLQGQPERDRIKELKSEERKLKREARQAEKIRRLEESLAEGKSTKPSPALSARKKRKASSSEIQETWNFKIPDLESSPETPELKEEKENTIAEETSKYSFLQGNHEEEFQEAELQTEDSPEIKSFDHLFPEEDFPLENDVPEEDYSEEDYSEEVFPEPASDETIPKKSSIRNPRSSEKEIKAGIQNVEQEISKQDEQRKKEYIYPPLRLLKRGSGKSQGDSAAHLRKTAQKLQDTLHNFGVNVTMTNVSCGPTVTRYELQPEMGVKVSRIVSLADDIKLNLATPDIRIEAPIPGKAAVGIEVPNKENSAVMLRDILQSEEYQSSKSKLSFAVGKDIGGKPVVADIAKMPHLLIAGATGSGKSVCINTLIISLIYKASPDEVKLIMIDPKVVELSVYNGIPHLLTPVVTDPKKAAGALNWAVSEMMKRYNTFAEFHVRNLAEYKHKIENMTIQEGEDPPESMPQIVIIVDELADLMMVAPGEVEDAICRLAQLARAAGIHLIIATQRPSVNVITGLIKANMPSRIAFSVSSGVDSRTILDMNGAEKLLGKGDMLFYPQGYQKPARIQGAFVSDEEVSEIVSFLAAKNPVSEYDKKMEAEITTAEISGSSDAEERDPYFRKAGECLMGKEKASIGMLQRALKVGFNRASRIMDQLAEAGVVGPEEGTKPRKVLMSEEQFAQLIEEEL